MSIMIFEYSSGDTVYVVYFVESGLVDINHIFLLFGCKNSNCDILFNPVLSFIICTIIDLSGLIFKLCKFGITTSRTKSFSTLIFLSDR